MVTRVGIALIGLSIVTTSLVAPPAAAQTYDPPCSKPTLTVGRTTKVVNGYHQGTPGNDVILGTAYADKIDGLGGNDIICGAGGNDTIKGGSGTDTIYGGPGDDTIYGGDGHDYIEGSEGADTINGDAGDDWLIGDVYWTTSTAGSGDTIKGGTGNDRIDGGVGNDVLHGDAGNDNLKGGTGTDNCIGGSGYADVIDDRSCEKRSGAERLSPTWDTGDLTCGANDVSCLAFSGYQGVHRSAATGGFPTKNLHNCTAYAAYRLYNRGMRSGFPVGDAYQWDNQPGSLVAVGKSSPAPGDIAHWETLGGASNVQCVNNTVNCGHVAYVERVNYSSTGAITSIVISESSWGTRGAIRTIAFGSSSWPTRFLRWDR